MSIKQCPLCGFGPIGVYPTISDLRNSYDICSCCGCEYGYDDALEHYDEWVKAGCEWFTPEDKPTHWKLEQQIENQIRPWSPKPGNN